MLEPSMLTLSLASTVMACAESYICPVTALSRRYVVACACVSVCVNGLCQCVCQWSVSVSVSVACIQDMVYLKFKKCSALESGLKNFEAANF